MIIPAAINISVPCKKVCLDTSTTCLLKKEIFIYNDIYAIEWAKHDKLSDRRDIFAGGNVLELIRTVEDWKLKIEPALASKVSELQLMGYKEATNENVWDCLRQKVWKGNPEKRLYEAVQDVFHLSSNIYMSYLTVSAYQDENDLFASIAALTGEVQA